MTTLKIGDAPKRREDLRFLTGGGRYLDDINFDGAAHVFILRSPYGHADIKGMDLTDALAAPGVVKILTGADQDAAGIQPMHPTERKNPHSGEPFIYPDHYPLAKGIVRYVGQAVALVIAETRNQARDASELIDIDFDERPVVTSIAEARKDPANFGLQWRTGDIAGVEAALESAAHVTSVNLHNHRVITNPMEPRGGVGVFDLERNHYTLHVSAQSLHTTRNNIALSLGGGPESVRLMASDVGGGFGSKNFMYAEHVLMLWAAREAGRPVKWLNERSEGFLSDQQARGHDAYAQLALDREGKFLAMRLEGCGDLGAYLTGGMGRLHTEQFATLPGGPYIIPAIELNIQAVYTNTAPIGVTRGPGFAESANIIEQLIDRAASEMELDRFELRRRNLAPSAPYVHTMGLPIDSGAFPQNFDAAMARAKDGFEDRRRQSEAQGKRRGLGVAYHIKATFGVPVENVELCFDEDDHLTLKTGTQSIGQGHETTFPQILSDLLGVPFDQIRYRHGDTDLTPKGGGHGSSRATSMAGTAMFRASEAVIEKGKRVAADALEAAEADIVFEDGQFQVVGTDRALDIMAVARLARKTDERGLDSFYEHNRTAHTFPNGCHVAEVEVDPDTGAVTLTRYTGVDDYGSIINPTVIAGQVHGAIAQGVGQALMETAVYEKGTGQLLSGSFMDYSMPRAGDLPNFDLSFNEIACTTNPLGVKGSGEAGAIGGFPAVINAVLDALEPYGVTALVGPATPENVWRAIKDAHTE
ncbi:MAG: xanthine dehydrogenase family protein molybdopterin-binding subunit [Alphaproteobacteria bacterium]|nr:xanthine dehydrogenase family protein molybdopterin-binding subunit [Alphaproteobacteria bacterium]